MAFMNQEKKAKIVAALKAIPEIKDWKYSVAVRNHSTIVMTIRSAPVDLIKHMEEVFVKDKLSDNEGVGQRLKDRYHQVNEFYLDRQFEGKTLKTFEKIKAALNLNNHDNSDPQTDYFDVGHYVNLSIGEWNRPFEVKKK